MSDRFDLVLSKGTVWMPGGPVETDIGVRDGRVVAFGALAGQGEQTLDCQGQDILPGVIDTQVHFREPGLEHKEDLETGTRGAVLGGVTGIFEMPNTKPGTTTAEALADKVQRAKNRAWCDFSFFIGAATDNIDTLGGLERLPGCAGIKVFMGSSTGSLLVAEDGEVARVLQQGYRRIAVHCEDEYRLKERWELVKDGAPVHMHPVWRDEETALRATQRLVRLAEAARRRVHVLHVTSAEEMAYLADHKDWATVETTPQHLTLAAPDAYDRLGTKAQMNPPIRDERHRDALWKAVAEGVVDVLGSDHAPHTLDEKAKPYPQSPSGMTGVQTLVPVMLTHVANGKLSLERFIDLTSAGPARIYNIQGKGRIALGYDADFTVIDRKASRTISDSWIASRAGWTPFDGFKTTGWPTATVVRGQIVMRDDELQGQAIGEPVRFLDTLL
ncbi:dihydroorotase [Insolitispirillum peregrinum]|uniref:Dihydroorotase n=1 Tax=Insolitispirillum peregrinum TaxID=80876 RepID=A0A1N7LD71_9PROT|nr:dihydroorotase [Insolitispirillum peregrinum]SIS71805.1 dihydroorotase [Insolitispirillum peregrinum]